MGKALKFFSYGLTLIVVCTFVYLYLSSPVYNGYISHNHQKYGIVYIRRDDFGIPTIKGSKLRDTYFGLGFSHCQDRLWSMDLGRRQATGRLSELFGNRTLDIDIQSREFGLNDIAKSIKLDDQARESLQAYADGINECSSNIKVRSLEYLSTMSTFEPWTVEDSIALFLQIELYLTQDFPAEIIRSKISKKYSDSAAIKIGLHWDKGHLPLETIMTEEDVKNMGLFQHFNMTKASFFDNTEAPQVSQEYIDKILESGISQYLGNQRGSNVWTVHGNHTTTGKPIVANDPHLDNSIPSFWYQAHLIYQNDRNITISGQSVPGLPGIFSGMTDYVAWGITALLNDVADLYSEKLNEDNTKYYFDGQWRDLKFRTEVIKIKGQKDYTHTVKETHHGPILQSSSEDANLSFCWANRVNTFNILNAQTNLYEATSVKQVLDAFSQYEANFGISFGTSDNHIGFYATGVIPLRNNPKTGSFIQDGSLRKNDWIGVLPRGQNPHLVDPSRGFIVAANNKITPNSAKGYPSINLPVTARAQRIREMIEEYIKQGKKISVEDMKKMQQDSLDVYAREAVKPMLDLYEKYKYEIYATNKTNITDSMMAHLKNWTYNYDLESVGATIFSTFTLNMGKKMLYTYSVDKTQRDKAIFNYMFDTFFINQIINWADDREHNSPWCDDNSCYGHKTNCLKLFFSAVQDTQAQLKKKLGENILEWKWSRVHHKQLPHNTFKDTPYVSKILNKSYPVSGNRRTVGANAENFANSDLNSIFSANMKAVYSLDKKEKSFFIIDTGISESYLSSHYSDQLAIYKKDQYIEVKRDLTKLKENNRDMLILVFDPKKSAKSEFSSDSKSSTSQQQKSNDNIKTDM